MEDSSHCEPDGAVNTLVGISYPPKGAAAGGDLEMTATAAAPRVQHVTVVGSLDFRRVLFYLRVVVQNRTSLIALLRGCCYSRCTGNSHYSARARRTPALL